MINFNILIRSLQKLRWIEFHVINDFTLIFEDFRLFKWHFEKYKKSITI